MCKHVAAVLYGVSVRLDTRPELFFDLRQVDQTELIGSATAGAASRLRPAAGKRIAAERLSAVFGIELERVGGPWATSACQAGAKIPVAAWMISSRYHQEEPDGPGRDPEHRR